jgi:hypothetical protein
MDVILHPDREILGAIQLALAMRPIANDEDVLDVVARLVRDVQMDAGTTGPTRLLVEAVKVEKGNRIRG